MSEEHNLVKCNNCNEEFCVDCGLGYIKLRFSFFSMVQTMWFDSGMCLAIFMIKEIQSQCERNPIQNNLNVAWFPVINQLQKELERIYAENN